jgi:hypothetical protein
MAAQNDEFLQVIKATGKQLAEAVKTSAEWFKNTMLDLNKRIRASQGQVFTKDATPEIGQMYMFLYDPKYKAVLPYYDMYPLVFPIEFYGDGFLGINLHYLPPLARAQLMTNLKTLATDKKLSDNARLNISYEVLRASAIRFQGYENCIKRYLFAHVRSSFHQVSPLDWDKAVILPLQRWQVNPNRKYAKPPPY